MSGPDAEPREDIDVERVASAFGSLADENRIAILLALWEGGPQGFADLQAAAGFDDSGHFNYHLDKLVGQFVERTDDDRYRLRAAGTKVIDIVHDERFAASTPSVDRPIDADCPECGATLHAHYEDGMVDISCSACHVTVHIGYFPPRGRTSRDLDAFLQAYARRLWRDFTLAHEGICPHCSGRIDTEIEVDPDWHLSVPATSECRDCGVEIGTAIGLRLLADPQVVAFLYDHGIAVDDRPFWELPFCIDDSDARVVSEDPLRVVVPIEYSAETLRVTVDEHARVVETERVSRRTGDGA
jgi:DNA-binding transcriptional ArsR family regulator